MAGKPRQTKRRKRARRRRTVRVNGKKTRRATSRRTRRYKVARSRTRSRPTRRRLKTVRKVRNRKPLVRRARRVALSGGAGTTHHVPGRGYLAASGSDIGSGILTGRIEHGGQESGAQSDELGAADDVSAVVVAEASSHASKPMRNYADKASSTQNTADPEAAGIQFGSSLVGAGVIAGLTKGASRTISRIAARVKGFKGSETDLADDLTNTNVVEGAPTASEVTAGSGNGDDSDDDGGSDEAGAESGAADSASSAAETAAAEAGVGFM